MLLPHAISPMENQSLLALTYYYDQMLLQHEIGSSQFFALKNQCLRCLIPLFVFLLHSVRWSRSHSHVLIWTSLRIHVQTGTFGTWIRFNGYSVQEALRQTKASSQTKSSVSIPTSWSLQLPSSLPLSSRVSSKSPDIVSNCMPGRLFAVNFWHLYGDSRSSCPFSVRSSPADALLQQHRYRLTVNN